MEGWGVSDVDQVGNFRCRLTRHVLEAMDQVRRKEQKELKKRGDQRLTGTKFLWLMTRAGKWTAAQRRAFRALRASTLKSARAWALKEAIRRLWELRSIPKGRIFFAWWYGWAMRSRPVPSTSVTCQSMGKYSKMAA